MKIATWNVNSVKARLQHLLDWLGESAPDIALLQENKCLAENFPREQVEDLGYNVAVVGQKSYNGVAILSRHPIEDITSRLPGDDEDEQARYVEAFTGGVRVASVYVPNGSEVGSEKFAYKMDFLERLESHLADILSYEEPCVIGGDYNVAPDPEDVYDHERLAGTVCHHPEEWNRYRALLNLGMTDAFRAYNPGPGRYTWWDYRAGGWQKDHGYRIDHLLLSPQASDLLAGSDVDRNMRGREKPSDHAPLWCEISI